MFNRRRHLSASAFLFLAFWGADAIAQTVPAIERAGPCVSCVPAGWTRVSESPDIITGDGPWPGGGYTVSQVGSAQFGGTMQFLLHNNTIRGGVQESVRTIVSGLTPNTPYRYELAVQGCRLEGAVTYTAEGGTLDLVINGQTATYTASGTDNWTPLSLDFVADGAGQASILVQAGSTDSPTGYGTCLVADAPDFVLLPASAVDLVDPADGTLTNDNTPTVSGKVGVGYVVTVSVEDANGATVQTLQAVGNASLDWNVDAMMLADGTYVIRANANNAQGTDPSTDGPHTITIDTTAPAVTITSPGALTNDNTPTLSGNTEAGAALVVQVLDDQGAVLQTFTPAVDAQGAWTVDATQLADGDYTLSIVATDPAGNASSPVTQGFEVDTTPPALTVTTLADNAITNDNTPTLSGTVEPGATVVVTILDANGAQVEQVNATVDAQGNWTIDAMTLPDGGYRFSVIATDAAGNTSAPENRGFTVDTVAPAVAILTPANGAVTNDNTPTLSGTVEPGAMFTVTLVDANNMSTTLSVMADAQGAWSVDASQLVDGAYTVQLGASDAAGNMAMASSTFTVDTTAPAISLTTPADGTQTNDDTPTISGSTEPGAAVVVQVLDDQGAVAQTLTPVVDAMGNWTVDAAQLPEGSYTISAVATDPAGNPSQPVTGGFSIDLTAPALTISSPAANSIVDTRDVDVAGTSDPGQDVSVELIDANGNVLGTQMATTDAQGNWTVTFTGVANGQVTARAKASDVAGNEATADQTFSVDSAEPNIAITTPVTDTSTNEVRPAIEGTTDDDATVSVVVTDSQGNEVATAQPTVDAQGNWTVALDADLADGDYTITATATRANGKMASTAVDITVDTVGPDTTITTPADGMVGNANQPEITGTTEPGATVDVTVTNAAGTVVFNGQVTADDQGEWSVTPDNPLADDVYTVDARSTDPAGNEGTTATSTFTVDTSAPTVTITSPANGDTVEDFTPTIAGTAEPGATVTVIIDGMEAGQATADDQGNWSFDVTDELAEGDHTIEAKTTDNAGNEGSSGELTITIDEPETPIVITSPTDGAQVTGPTITVTGTGEPGETITVTINGQSETVTVGDDGSWSVTFEDVPEGNQTIEASEDEDEVVTVNVTVTNPVEAAKFYVTGGCSSSPTDAPTDGLWLLVLLIVGVRRRK